MIASAPAKPGRQVTGKKGLGWVRILGPGWGAVNKTQIPNPKSQIPKKSKSQRNRGPGGSWRTRERTGDADRFDRSIEAGRQCRVFAVRLKHETVFTQILTGPGRHGRRRPRMCAPDASGPILPIYQCFQRRVAPRAIDELALSGKPRTVPELNEAPGGVRHGFDGLRSRGARECRERQHSHESAGYQSTNAGHSAHHTVMRSYGRSAAGAKHATWCTS